MVPTVPTCLINCSIIIDYYLYLILNRMRKKERAHEKTSLEKNSEIATSKVRKVSELSSRIPLR